MLEGVGLDEDFGYGSPDPRIDADFFTGSIEGEFEAPLSEEYLFRIWANEDITLYITDPADGRILVQYEDGPGGNFDPVVAGRAQLEAGQRYRIQVKFAEGRGPADYYVHWQSPSTPRQAIPKE